MSASNHCVLYHKQFSWPLLQQTFLGDALRGIIISVKHHKGVECFHPLPL